MAKNMMDSTKGADNLGEITANIVIAYGAEIKRECCHTFVETIYGIFYNE